MGESGEIEPGNKYEKLRAAEKLEESENIPVSKITEGRAGRGHETSSGVRCWRGGPRGG